MLFIKALLRKLENVLPMPCPWYQHGVCTSPKLPEPSDAVVSVTRCTSDKEYKSCTYYVEPTQLPQKLSRREKLRVYAPIHALPSLISIECPKATVTKLESGIIIAYCKVLDRALTKFEAELCRKYWKECPYRYTEPI
jgi:hypothetical protein